MQETWVQPWVRNIPWRRKWQPPVFCLENHMDRGICELHKPRGCKAVRTGYHPSYVSERFVICLSNNHLLRFCKQLEWSSPGLSDGMGLRRNFLRIRLTHPTSNTLIPAISLEMSCTENRQHWPLPLSCFCFFFFSGLTGMWNLIPNQDQTHMPCIESAET